MIRWRYITGDVEPASRALASDEFLMSKYATWAAGDYPEPTLRIYTYRSHCALVGKFQNTEAEVNLPECRARGIEVNRRMTGGGAIIMGEDQLMVALASSAEHPIVPAHPARIFPKMVRGLIMGLAEMGLDAEFRTKNDVVVNGRKICGTGICIEESGAFMFQATVLLDFDTSLMTKALNIPAEKISDKGISSAEDRITTVAQELGHPVDLQQAREAICRGFEYAFKMSAVHTPFIPVELEQIERIEREKYLTDEWIYQRQPASDMLGTALKKTPAGLIRAYMALAGDTIKSVLITGDFLSGGRAIKDIESALKWGRSDRDSIARTIKVIMSVSPDFPHGLDPDDLAAVIHEAAENARSRD